MTLSDIISYIRTPTTSLTAATAAKGFANVGAVKASSNPALNLVNLSQLVNSSLKVDSWKLDLYDIVTLLLDEALERSGLTDDPSGYAMQILGLLDPDLDPSKLPALGHDPLEWGVTQYGDDFVKCSIQLVSTTRAQFVIMGVLVATLRIKSASEWEVINVQSAITDDEYYLWENIGSAISDDFANLAIVEKVLQMTPVSGKTSVAPFLALLDRSTPTPFINDLKDNLGYSEVDANIICSAISTAITQMADGSQEPGSPRYTPLKTPGYSTSILQTVLAVVATVTVTTLSLIFNRVGAIISFLASTISSLVNRLSGKLDQTTFKVVSDSSFPVWNWPLTDALPVSDQRISWFYRTHDDEINDVVKAFGSCLVIPNGGSVALWVYPRGNEAPGLNTLMAQVVILGFWTDISDRGGNRAYTVSGNTISTSRNIGAFSQSTDLSSNSWMSRDSVQLKNIMYRSILSMLLSTNCVTGFVNWSTHIDLDDITSLGFKGLVESVDMMNEDLERRASMLVALTQYAYDQGSAGAIAEEELMTVLANHRPLLEAAAIGYVQSVGSDLSATSVIPPVYAVGNDAANPALECPITSRNSLLTALAVSAVAVGAVAVSAYATRRVVSRKVLAKMQLRQQQYDEAVAAVQANPGDKILQKNLYRANKKLGKSWSRAAACGITSVNGFATSSTPLNTSDGSTPSDAIIALASASGTNEDVIQHIDAIYTLLKTGQRDIYRSITGLEL